MIWREEIGALVGVSVSIWTGPTYLHGRRTSAKQMDGHADSPCPVAKTQSEFLRSRRARTMYRYYALQF